MGGGPVHLMNQLVWGVDLVEEQMLASAGIPSRPYISKRPNQFVAEYSVNAKHTGIIKNLDFLKVQLVVQNATLLLAPLFCKTNPWNHVMTSLRTLPCCSACLSHCCQYVPYSVQVDCCKKRLR